jgi:hypothetical protein
LQGIAPLRQPFFFANACWQGFDSRWQVDHGPM